MIPLFQQNSIGFSRLGILDVEIEDCSEGVCEVRHNANERCAPMEHPNKCDWHTNV